MIANPAIPHPAALPLPFSLNDLRVHSAVAEEPSSVSALTLYGLVLAVVLAVGAFIWLDPLHLFSPTEASPPAPAIVPSAEPARPIERQEIIAPLAPVPATKSVEVPVAPPPVIQAPHVPAPVIRPRAANTKPESRSNPMDSTNSTVLKATPMEKTAPPVLLSKPESGGNPMDSTNSTVLKATPMETTAPPVLLSKPEEMTTPPALPTKPVEKTDAPIILKPADDTANAPKPAATKDPAPVTE